MTEDAPTNATKTGLRQELLVLSARSETALDAMALRLADHLERESLDLADVAHTLATGPRAFPLRRVIVAADNAGAIARLRQPGKTADAPATAPQVAFLIPGEGSSAEIMGRELYDTEPQFRAAVDECATLLLPLLRQDVRSTLYPSAPDILRPPLTQPCGFVAAYALAKLWMSWGIQPSLLIGHGTGEYVAAVLAGSFKLEHALHLLVNRTRLLQQLPAGTMLAVRAGADQLTLPNGIDLAAINSPRDCTLSGSHEAISAFQQDLEARKTGCSLMKVSHALHSGVMEPILPIFTGDAAMIPFNPPGIPWISTCTGVAVDAATLADPGHWARQLRHPVRFTEALATAFTENGMVLLEIGSGQALAPFARQHPGRGTTPVLPAIATSTSGLTGLLAALGELWKSGVIPDWPAFFNGVQRARLQLPIYSLERPDQSTDGSGELIQPAEVQRPPTAASLTNTVRIPDPAASEAPFPGKPAFNVSVRFQLEGELDRGLLKSALHAMAARHEALRTRFITEDGELRQVVAPEIAFPLLCRDLSKLSGNAQAAELDRLGSHEARTPFDLSRAPLFRANLVLTTRNRHILQITIHQSVADSRSIGNLTGELEELYNAESASRPIRFEPLAIQSIHSKREFDGVHSPLGIANRRGSQAAIWHHLPTHSPAETRR